MKLRYNNFVLIIARKVILGTNEIQNMEVLANKQYRRILI